MSLGAKEDLVDDLVDVDEDDLSGGDGLGALGTVEVELDFAGDRFPLPPLEGINLGVSSESSVLVDEPLRAAPRLRVNEVSSSSISSSSRARRGDGVMIGGRATLFRVLRPNCLIDLSSVAVASSAEFTSEDVLGLEEIRGRKERPLLLLLSSWHVTADNKRTTASVSKSANLIFGREFWSHFQLPVAGICFNSEKKKLSSNLNIEGDH